MNKLPDTCKDCAEFGSDFCEDCLKELTDKLSDEDKVLLSKAIRNIAGNTKDM